MRAKQGDSSHMRQAFAVLLALNTLAYSQQYVGPTVTDQVTASWTSSTTINTDLRTQTQGFNTALVTLAQGSTLTAGFVNFEASDTATAVSTDNWFGVPCAAPTTNIAPQAGYGLTASTNVALHCNIVGFQRFRVRLGGTISGTGTVTPKIQLSSLGNPQPGPLSNATTGKAIASASITSVTTNAGILDKLIFGTEVASATFKVWDLSSANCTGSPSSPIFTFTLPSTVSNPFEVDPNLTIVNGICVQASSASELVTVLFH